VQAGDPQILTSSGWADVSWNGHPACSWLGGGKAAKFGLTDKAAALGAGVALLEGPGIVDVAALARQAVDRGADLPGVAGGDGTQAPVAAIATARDVPTMITSAGTRRPALAGTARNTATGAQ